MSTILRVVQAVGVAAFLAATSGSAGAQSGVAQPVLNAPSALAELRARQSDLFQKLIEAPDNLDIMFEYATISIRLEDYEAAISTLERMLIYRQDLSRVRLELAVAYFNLGSYEASKLYFDQVLRDPETPANVRARIDRYMEAIAVRTRTSSLSGIATIGFTSASNATLGPESNEVVLNNNLAVLQNGQQEADSGVRALLAMSHIYDLQQENADVWKTDLSVFTVRYFDTEEGNVGFARLRTGPRLSMDNQQFGPKIRPYVEAQYLNSQDDSLFVAYGGGAEYSNTLSPILSSFADIGLRYRDFLKDANTGDDTTNFYSSLGLAYIPSRDIVLRGTGLFELDSADSDENSNVEIGLRVSAEYQFDSTFEWVDRKWSASAFAEVRGRFFDAVDPVIGVDDKRQDIDLRGGASFVYTLQQGFGIQLDIDGLVRRSNIANFDLSNVSTTVSLQYRF